MLLLGINEDDYITIGSDIKIHVLKSGNVITVGIDAPKEMTILRKKLHEDMTGVKEEPYDYRAKLAAKRAAKKTGKF